MIDAALRGKLVCLDSEDALTSAVFGRLRYLPASILLEWLRCAWPWRRRRGDHLEGLAGALDIQLWPQWRDTLRGYGTVEPDVVVIVGGEVVVIEAKLWMGKSVTEGEDDSQDGPDQLARQWKAGIDLFALASPALRLRALVYLTPHPTPPKEALDESLAALSNAGEPNVALYWLSWSALEAPLRSVWSTSPEARISQDILSYLDRVGLLRFNGWHLGSFPLSLHDVIWTYRQPLHRYFSSCTQAPTPTWRYQASERYFSGLETGIVSHRWAYRGEQRQ